MILIDSNNTNQILAFVPLIRENYSDWHIVTLKFNATDEAAAQKTLEEFMKIYENADGFCYLESNEKATCVIQLRKIENYSDIQRSIEKNIKGKTCKVLARKMNASGLKKIQINLCAGEGTSDESFFIEREARSENVILIAEDDMFVRKILCSLLNNIATTHEVESGNNVLDQYKKINPDIVLLDIHLPQQNGLDILKALNSIDSSAFILMSSSDSVKENVLASIKDGAVGFLAKPIQKDKLFLYLEQCVTFNKTKENEHARQKKNTGS